MTYDEYKALYKEWRETDSKSRCEEIEDTIESVAIDLLRKLVSEYAMRGKRFVDDSDYRSDRGSLCIDVEELLWNGGTSVYLTYTDRWQYGGKCRIGIRVPMKYLDEKAFTELDKKLKKEQLETLEREVEKDKKTVERLKEIILKSEQKIAKLKEED